MIFNKSYINNRLDENENDVNPVTINSFNNCEKKLCKILFNNSKKLITWYKSSIVDWLWLCAEFFIFCYTKVWLCAEIGNSEGLLL